VLLVSFFLMMGSFSLLTFFSPLQLIRVGMDRSLIGPIQCVGVVVEIVIFWWGGRWLRRFSYAATVQIGCACLVLRQVFFATSDRLWLLASSYALAGMVVVFYHTGVSVIVNALAAPSVRATAQTLLLLCGAGMGPIMANAVAVRLTQASATGQGLQAVFWFAAILAGLALLLLLMWGRTLNAAAAHGTIQPQKG
jgi:PPP family 3-phenylpropionic acid transporter